MFRLQFQMFSTMDLGNRFASLILFSNYLNIDLGHMISLMVRALI